MTNNQNEPKEIDLIELFRLIGKNIKDGILGIIKTILFLFVFGIKNTHWMLIFLIIGMLTGYLFFSNTARYYSSNMIVHPNGIVASDIIQYINDLGNFTETNNIEAIAKAMNQNDSVAMKLKSIQAYPYLDINKDGTGDFLDLIGKYNPMDTNIVIANDRVYIQVEVFDNKSFNSIKQGVFNYFSKNDYFERLYQLHKENLQEHISFNKNEIAKLDSLQNVDYFQNYSQKFSQSKNSQLMFLSEKDKQMYYKDKAYLVNQKQTLEKELQLADAPLTIIKGFAELTTEENTKGGYLIRFGFWFGVAGFFVLMILKYQNEIKRFIS